MRSSINLVFLAVASLVAAQGGDDKVHKVDVAKDGLKFTPSTITAAKGDVVEFHFYPQKHDVVQGSFDTPCKVGSLTGGFASGYIPIAKGESTSVFRVTINSTDPIYFYCSQISHCQNGMVGAINPPSSGNTLAAYTSAASQTTDSETPPNVQGGVIATSSGDDDDDSSSSSSGATSATTSASTGASSATSSAGSSAASSVSSSATRASSSAASVASTAASSTTAVTTGNAAAGLGRVSYEMLGLAGVAGGVAIMMQ